MNRVLPGRRSLCAWPIARLVLSSLATSRMVSLSSRLQSVSARKALPLNVLVFIFSSSLHPSRGVLRPPVQSSAAIDPPSPPRSRDVKSHSLGRRPTPISGGSRRCPLFHGIQHAGVAVEGGDRRVPRRHARLQVTPERRAPQRIELLDRPPLLLDPGEVLQVVDRLTVRGGQLPEVGRGRAQKPSFEVDLGLPLLVASALGGQLR